MNTLLPIEKSIEARITCTHNWVHVLPTFKNVSRTEREFPIFLFFGKISFYENVIGNYGFIILYWKIIKQE